MDSRTSGTMALVASALEKPIQNPWIKLYSLLYLAYFRIKQTLMKQAKTANSMWGGRFSKSPAALLQEINASISFDKTLWQEDIAGSKAHADMLQEAGILSAADVAAIHTGLAEIEHEIIKGTFPFREDLEDIHMNIEAVLAEKIGDAAKRLHTGRSRNDQVATDFKLWLRQRTIETQQTLQNLQAALLQKAETYYDAVMPGFTHLQVAQPVTFGHHLLAYVEMFGRDNGRFRDAYKRMEECPLGAAALAGTSYPIDRQATATALGFTAPTTNSMDSVSDRDFALEYLSAASITAVHLSRLAEELVLWCCPAFNFIRLSDAYTTGSSIMPQKRNPDAAELVRGKTGRIIAALQSLLIMLKGLPLTYSKDMQEDKEPVFDAVRSLLSCLTVMTGMIEDLTANREAMRAATDKGFATATDLADWLVQELKMPFRDAHHVTGSLVKIAEQQGILLENLPLATMQEIEPRLTDAVYTVLTVEGSVARRTSFGGTAPENVKNAILLAKKKYT